MKKLIVLPVFLLVLCYVCLLSWKLAPPSGYMILRLWGPADVISESENEDFRIFKGKWEKENITVKEHQWKSGDELTSYFTSLGYNLKVVSACNGLQIKGNAYNFSSTGTKIIFILDNRKPVGYFIGDNYFDKIQTMLDKIKE